MLKINKYCYKTQRDVILLQKTGDHKLSYYSSYYSDDGEKPFLNEADNIALLSKSWHGFQLGGIPPQNIISQHPSKNIKIIEKFEVNGTKKDST